MNESTVLNLISTGGAAVVLFYIVYLFVNGKIHSESELKARDDVIEKLEVMNKSVVDQLRQTNDIFERAVERGYTQRERAR